MFFFDNPYKKLDACKKCRAFFKSSPKEGVRLTKESVSSIFPPFATNIDEFASQKPFIGYENDGFAILQTRKTVLFNENGVFMQNL